MNEEQLSISNDDSELDFCCFENLIDELPNKYGEVLSLINVEGKRQKDVAKELDISISNIKSRVHRAKEMLKQKYVDCCQYSLNEKGLLVGEQNCQRSSCATN